MVTIAALVQNLRKWILRLLIGAQLLLVAQLLKNWLYAASYRLYVEDRIDTGPQDGMMWQQFNIQDKRVIPQIFTEGSARLKFPVQFQTASTLWITAASSGRAEYEIHLLENGFRRLLYRREINGQALDRVALLPCNGILEISSHGSFVWSDLRIVNGRAIAPYLIALGILLLASLILLWKSNSRRLPHPDAGRRKVFLFMGASITGSIILTFFLLEAAMQVFGAPAGIRTLRRDLGEVSQDPQWEDSPRYGSRLRRNQNTALQWSGGGDIVRMGFIPPAALSTAPGPYSLRTDAEGFRNTRVRDTIHVAALGDSFTDGLTLPVDQIWPTRLEQNLGLPVQNFGTAGFGPQQELRVLRDYAIRHHPRVVLLAFFAGNDIVDAERFDKYERSEGSVILPKTGWSIKKVVARYETFYSFSLLQLAGNTLGTRAAGRPMEGTKVPYAVDQNPEISGDPAESVPGFDRGIFTIPVKERTLRFALMPPYLQTLTFSEDALEKRSGWQLTRKTILEMNRVSHENGARLVVLFIPFKSQVYLPLLRRSFGKEDLERDFQFYFRQEPTGFDSNEMSQNRLAQNHLMQRLCEDEHIPLIDPTAALQAEVESGRNVYFPDDSHWNAAGHELAANVIAAFLKSHGLDQNKE